MGPTRYARAAAIERLAGQSAPWPPASDPAPRDLRITTLAVPGGDLEARFAVGAGMVGCSLRHRGDELLGLRGGLDAYLERGKTFGLPLLYPWANRLGAWELRGRRARRSRIERGARAGARRRSRPADPRRAARRLPLAPGRRRRRRRRRVARGRPRLDGGRRAARDVPVRPPGPDRGRGSRTDTLRRRDHDPRDGRRRGAARRSASTRTSRRRAPRARRGRSSCRR